MVMDDFDDPADLDGDGEFDAIDMEILDGEEEDQQQPTSNVGCSVLLLSIGASAWVGGWSISRFIV